MDLIGVVELVVHEASDDTGFADGLVSQKKPACISLKPIPGPYFLFRLPIYITVILLLRDFSNFGLQKRGSHIVSPRLATLS